MTRLDLGLIEGVFLAILFLVIASVEDAPRPDAVQQGEVR